MELDRGSLLLGTRRDPVAACATCFDLRMAERTSQQYSPPRWKLYMPVIGKLRPALRLMGPLLQSSSSNARGNLGQLREIVMDRGDRLEGRSLQSGQARGSNVDTKNHRGTGGQRFEIATSAYRSRTAAVFG